MPTPTPPAADRAAADHLELDEAEAALMVLGHPRLMALVPMYPDVPGVRWRCDLAPVGGQGHSFLADTPLAALAKAAPELVKGAGSTLE